MKTLPQTKQRQNRAAAASTITTGQGFGCRSGEPCDPVMTVTAGTRTRSRSAQPSLLAQLQAHSSDLGRAPQAPCCQVGAGPGHPLSAPPPPVARRVGCDSPCWPGHPIWGPFGLTLKKRRRQGWWRRPGIPDFQEAEAEGSQVEA